MQTLDLNVPSLFVGDNPVHLGDMDELPCIQWNSFASLGLIAMYFAL